jgi:outer membrane protein TolC
MRLLLLILVVATLNLNASLKRLSLNRALELLEENNLEIKVSKYEEMMKFYDIAKVKAKNFGTIDLEITALRSNDPGNVFGFKVQSRDATFADFGFADFMGALGQGVQQSAMMDPNHMPNFAYFAQGLNQNGASILAIKPDALNYPKPRTHFLTKISYKVPLYTGGMLTNYKKITTKMYKMSKIDTQKVMAMKRYELKKAFYDVGLVNSFISNLNEIKRNIGKLKKVIKEMQREGYAVETDYLEVDAKLAEVEAMLDEAKLNKELAYHFISFLIDQKVSSIIAPKSSPRVPRVTKDTIVNRNLDIAKARMGLKITKDAIEVEKAKFKPTVGAFVEYGNANDKLFKYTKKGFYTFGVQAKMNLFNGGADKASLEKAKTHYLKVSTQVILAKKGMWLKASKLKAQIKSLTARVRSYQKQYKFSQRVYLTYKTKYKEGLVSITDLLIKQSLEIEKLMKLLQIKNERNAKILELQNLINQ